MLGLTEDECCSHVSRPKIARAAAAAAPKTMPARCTSVSIPAVETLLLKAVLDPNGHGTTFRKQGKSLCKLIPESIAMVVSDCRC